MCFSVPSIPTGRFRIMMGNHDGVTSLHGVKFVTIQYQVFSMSTTATEQAAYTWEVAQRDRIPATVVVGRLGIVEEQVWTSSNRRYRP